MEPLQNAFEEIEAQLTGLAIATLAPKCLPFFQSTLRNHPLGAFTVGERASYPHLPKRVWTEEELFTLKNWLQQTLEGTIDQWLTEGTIGVMTERTQESLAALKRVRAIESYFQMLLTEAWTQLGELVQNDHSVQRIGSEQGPLHAAALAAAYKRGPGEA